VDNSSLVINHLGAGGGNIRKPPENTPKSYFFLDFLGSGKKHYINYHTMEILLATGCEEDFRQGYE